MKLIDISTACKVQKCYRKILADLKKIDKLIGANSTNVSGELSVSYTGYPVEVFDAAIEMITEYSRHKHFVTINPKLTIKILLD